MNAMPSSVEVVESARQAEAIVLQWSYKPEAMRRMMVAVCRLALAKGLSEFSANDLDEFEHGGRGICGSVFGPLARQGVLAPVGTFEGKQFFPRVVSNAGGNPVRVWRLKNAALARALLRAHGQAEAEMKQQELAVVG